MSKSLPVGASINHILNLKHVIRNHISVGVKHMLKFCSVLNGHFLELEPTFFLDDPSLLLCIPLMQIILQYTYGSVSILLCGFYTKSPIDTSHT